MASSEVLACEKLKLLRAGVRGLSHHTVARCPLLMRCKSGKEHQAKLTEPSVLIIGIRKRLKALRGKVPLWRTQGSSI